MTKQYLKAAFAALGIAAIATACRGGGNYAPLTGPEAFAAQNVATAAYGLLRGHGSQADLNRAAAISCSAPAGPVPGNYTLFLASGNVKGAKFTAVESQSFYLVEHFTKATPPPTPSTSPSTGPTPTTGPTPVPQYFYYGTYTLAKGLGGCAYLIATVSGKPPAGSKYNASSLGFPKLKAQYYNAKLLLQGSLTMTVGSLSSSGGTGSFVLKNSSGGTYNTGKIKLVGRITTP